MVTSASVFFSRMSCWTVITNCVCVCVFILCQEKRVVAVPVIQVKHKQVKLSCNENTHIACAS